MFAVLLELPADESGDIETEAALQQCALIFDSNLANLFGEIIHGLVEAVVRLRSVHQSFLEVRYRLVSNGSESGSHDEERTLSLVIHADLPRRDDLATRRQSRIGDADDSFVHDHPQTKSHSFLPVA